MMPKYHFITSLVLAGVFFVFTGDIQATVLCFLSGFLLDVDHMLDFWTYKGKVTISPEIYQGFYKRFGKVPVLLHSIELLIPIWVLGYAGNLYLFSLAISLGFMLHLILDFACYEMRPYSYFLIFRIAKNFNMYDLCKR